MGLIEEQMDTPKCKFLGCEENAENIYTKKFWSYCKFHRNGGCFGSGETYEQYQIIEQDFIDFIKYVPLQEEHLTVHSPVLRDIIIRACVQIEIFFKEWGKYKCCEDPECSLLKSYNKGNGKKERNWNFGDYFFLRDEFKDFYSIHVLPISIDIIPFEDWKSEKAPPWWWNVYNGIKHNGHTVKKDANLKTAMYTLAALFLMHCINYRSKSYLNGFNYSNVKSESFGKAVMQTIDITTPLDSKRYLFKANSSNSKRTVELVTQDQLKKVIGKSRGWK